MVNQKHPGINRSWEINKVWQNKWRIKDNTEKKIYMYGQEQVYIFIAKTKKDIMFACIS